VTPREADPDRSVDLIRSAKPDDHGPRGVIRLWEIEAMTLATSIDYVGPLKATEMIQSARAEAAIEHRPGLHTVTREVPAIDPAEPGPSGHGRSRPASRRVDISV
jgi:hypothetical protein